MKTSHKFSWLVLDRAIRLVTTFANTAIIARSLGPNAYGDFAKGLLVYTFADSLCSLGIPVVLAGKIASGKAGNIRSLLAKSIGSRLAAGVAVYAAFGMYALWGARSGAGSGIIAGMLLGLFTSQWVFGDAFLQGVGEPQRGAIAKISVASSFTVVRLVALVFHPRLEEWVALFVIEQAALTIAMLTQCRRHAGPPRSPIVHPTLGFKALRRDASFVWASQMATLLYMRIDQVAIAALSTPVALASYSIASQLIEQAYTIPVIINGVTISELGRARQESSRRFDHRMVRQYSWGIVLGITCAAMMAVVGRLAVVRLYGQGYSLARTLVPILAIAIPFVTLGTLQVSEIVLAKSSKILLWKAGCSAVVSAPLALIGWWLFGLCGLAISAVAVQILSCVVLNYWVDRDALAKQLGAVRLLVDRTVGEIKKLGAA